MLNKDQIDDFNIKIRNKVGEFLFRNYNKKIEWEIEEAFRNICEKSPDLLFLIFCAGKAKENIDFTAAAEPNVFDVVLYKNEFNQDTHSLTIEYYVADNNYKWHKFILTFESKVTEVF